jgi:hypothetical protein
MNNKKRGNTAEVHYMNIFKQCFPFCCTTRSSSKLLDDCGIDLNFIPFNVQIKYGYKNGLNYKKLIEYIKENIKEKIPKTESVHNYFSIVIHRKVNPTGKRRTDELDIVAIERKHYVGEETDIISYYRKTDVVLITFNHFKKIYLC